MTVEYDNQIVIGKGRSWIFLGYTIVPLDGEPLRYQGKNLKRPKDKKYNHTSYWEIRNYDEDSYWATHDGYYYWESGAQTNSSKPFGQGFWGWSEYTTWKTFNGVCKALARDACGSPIYFKDASGDWYQIIPILQRTSE